MVVVGAAMVVVDAMVGAGAAVVAGVSSPLSSSSLPQAAAISASENKLAKISQSFLDFIGFCLLIDYWFSIFLFFCITLTCNSLTGGCQFPHQSLTQQATGVNSYDVVALLQPAKLRQPAGQHQ